MDLYLITTLPLADRFENKSFSKHQLSIEFVQAAVKGNTNSIGEKECNCLKLISLVSDLGFRVSPFQEEIEQPTSPLWIQKKHTLLLKYTSSLPGVSGQGVGSLNTKATT